MNKIKDKKISGLPQVGDSVTVSVGNQGMAGARGLGGGGRTGDSEDRTQSRTDTSQPPWAPSPGPRPSVGPELLVPSYTQCGEMGGGALGQWVLREHTGESTPPQVAALGHRSSQGGGASEGSMGETLGKVSPTPESGSRASDTEIPHCFPPTRRSACLQRSCPGAGLLDFG